MNIIIIISCCSFCRLPFLHFDFLQVQNATLSDAGHFMKVRGTFHAWLDKLRFPVILCSFFMVYFKEMFFY